MTGNTLRGISGALLFLGLVATLIHTFFPVFPSWPSTAVIWSAALILCFYLASSQKKLVIVLGSLSVVAWVFSWSHGYAGEFTDAFSINQSLVVLMIGVNLLQLVAAPQDPGQERLPTGEGAFVRTYLGLLLFGAIISLSAVLLVGNRLIQQAPFTGNQHKLLTRSFASAANWSPFWAAFGAATLFAPEAKLSIVVSAGLSMAVLGFLLTWHEVRANQSEPIHEFSGYPMHFELLWLPSILSLLVIVAHYLFPSVKIILLVALLSTLICIAVLGIRHTFATARLELQQHIIERLPDIRGELVLFLVAGMFGTGLAAVIDVLNISFPFAVFDGITASILLLAIIVVAIFGMHPIVSITVIGHWAAPYEPNQTLIAMTFVTGWAMAIILNPFSGLALTLHGRYGTSGFLMFKRNLPYAIKLYCGACILLLTTDYFLGT